MWLQIRQSSGDPSAVAPPVPIPNTEVKRCSPNGSASLGCARVGRRQNYEPRPVKAGRGSLVLGFLFKSFSSCVSSSGANADVSVRTKTGLTARQQSRALNDSPTKGSAIDHLPSSDFFDLVKVFSTVV